MNEVPHTPNPEVNNDYDGYELNSETIKNLMASPEQHRFVRAGNKVWVMESDMGNHFQLATEVAAISPENLAVQISDAGFMQPLGDLNLLAITGHSSHLESYRSKLSQLQNRPETAQLVQAMAPEIKIHT